MSDQSEKIPVRLGMIGAGLFARDAHVPALYSLDDDFVIAAVYSRTADSADKLNALLPEPADVYTDLDALLARDDIDAVDVLLPITLQPAIIQKALAAGKHVLSEKPVAPDVATAAPTV